jgi:hypothetical protein
MSLVIDTSDMDLEMEDTGITPEQVSEPIADQEAETEMAEAAVEIEPEPEPVKEDSEDEPESDDFRTNIWNAEMRCRGKEAIVEDLKEQLKFAKADYEDSVSALRKLATWGNKPKVEPVRTADPEPTGTNPESIPNPTGTQPEHDESWRQSSFVDLLKTAEISGMGDKKLESLCDICKTFGDFEDLRTKASLDGVHLKEVLPTGFGEKITDQIEEAYFAAIKNLPSRSEDTYSQAVESEPEELSSEPEELEEDKPEELEIEVDLDPEPEPETETTIDLDDL